jgi:hypothetical protein
MDHTPRLTLPFIMPSQAQKHITHNQAIEALDALVQPAVESRIVATPARLASRRRGLARAIGRLGCLGRPHR